MRINTEIPPYKKDFPSLLSDYFEQITDAIRQKKHHDQRRALFMNFLRMAFGVDPSEVILEEKIKVGQVRGYIDALYKYIIFEFKTDMERERSDALFELKKYFASQADPSEYIAVVSDGLRFEIYHFENGEVTSISKYSLDKEDINAAHRFFDNILFASKKITPKSIDITTRFGLESAIYNRARIFLNEQYDIVKKVSSVKVKIGEWNSLLRTVYGDLIGNQDLFIRHTYLALFSRLMVANALYPKSKRNKIFYKGIITGDFFRKNNLPNLAEPDFFAWALDTDIENDFLGFWSKIETYLNRFRFENVGEDLLKEIYQELVDPESRHSLGEYYTPDWIADLTLDRLKYKDGKILDPSCGSGSFLLAVIRRYKKQGLTGKKLLNKTIDNVIGIDVHPLAVIMTKANMVLALMQEIKKSKNEIYLPVYMADSLLAAVDKKRRTIHIPISANEAFNIPLQTIERKSNVDILIDTLTKTSSNSNKDKNAVTKALKGLGETVFADFSGDELFFWRQNFRLLCKLVKENRNSVWGFILKNAYRPAFIRNQKVDFVVGGLCQ